MTKQKTEAGQADPELIEVTLTKPHTHKRKPYKAGDKIRVTSEQKVWLESQGVCGGMQEESSNG